MKAEVLKALLQAHAEGDDQAFRRAALKLAASESKAGHTRSAEELRGIISTLPLGGSRQGRVVDIAKPRGELADVLDAGYRDERFSDIVLNEHALGELTCVLREARVRGKLEQFGVEPRRKLLFHGPPGCGKTLAAAVLAGELGVPLLTVRLAALFSRFLGATASQLGVVFSEMPRRPGVYLFDEFDALAKARGDAQDVGEMNRVVTSFLQLMDADVSASIVIAATNHPQLLDRAVFRRFHLSVEFTTPDLPQAEALIRLRLARFALDDATVASFAKRADGLSFAEVAGACDDAVRNMVLEERTKLLSDDIDAAVHRLGNRVHFTSSALDG